MTLKRTGDGPDPRQALEVGAFRILSLDPGGTSGWASAHYNGLAPLKTTDDIKWDGGHLGPGDHHKLLWNYLSELYWASEPAIYPTPLEIVMESFDFRQNYKPGQERNKVELISREYIGIVRLFCEMNSVPLHMQNASTAKTFIPDKGPRRDVRIKQLGLARPRPEWEHYMDAMRHLLRHIVVDKKVRQPFVDRWLAE